MQQTGPVLAQFVCVDCYYITKYMTEKGRGWCSPKKVDSAPGRSPLLYEKIKGANNDKKETTSIYARVP
ncbi:MAG TPA: hypothetical protein V6C69_04435, partial [Trichormus sp.]